MWDDRVIIPFPGDTIRLNGVLRDALSTLHCATSNLTYKRSVHISSVFLLTASEAILSAMKSISAKSEIAFDTKCAALYAEKNLLNMTAEVVLTSLLITSIEKTVSIYSAFVFSDEIELAAEKALAQSENIYELSDQIEFWAEKGNQIYAEFDFEMNLLPMSAEQALVNSDAMMRIVETLSLAAEKYSGEILSSAEFSSSVKLCVMEFRKMSDLTGLTFADISTWDMQTFHVIMR